MRSIIGIALLILLSVTLSGCASSTKPTGLVSLASYPTALMIPPEKTLRVDPGESPGEELAAEVQRAQMSLRWRKQLLLLQEWVDTLYDGKMKERPP